MPYASPHNFDDILDGDDAVLGRGDLRHDDGHDLSVVVVVLKIDVGVLSVEIDAFVILGKNGNLPSFGHKLSLLQMIQIKDL